MKSVSLCNKVSNKLNFNGDDAVVLFRGDSPTSPTDEEVVDSFGTIGVDPGTAWAVCDGESAADATHVRKPHVDKGSRSWADTGDAATAGENCEWTALAQDDISGLGTHHAEPKVPRTPLMSKVIEGQGYDKAVEVALSLALLPLRADIARLTSSSRFGHRFSTQHAKRWISPIMLSAWPSTAGLRRA